MIGGIAMSGRHGSRKLLVLYHVVGGLVGSLLLGTTAGLAGAVASMLLDRTVLRWMLAAALVALAACDVFGLSGVSRLVTRQTPRQWDCILGTPGAVFAWGADLGMGLTTRIGCRSTLALVAVPALSANYWLGVGFCCSFGVARATGVGIAAAGPAEPSDVCEWLGSTKGSAQRRSGFVLGSIATTLAVSLTT